MIFQWVPGIKIFFEISGKPEIFILKDILIDYITTYLHNIKPLASH